MEFDVTGFGLAQPEFEVITQVTTSPFSSVLVVNTALFVPTFVAPIFHWYTGVVPPFIGVAVKVADAPEHSGFEPAVNAIETEGTMEEETVTGIVLDETVAVLDPNVSVIFGRRDVVDPVVCVHAPAPPAPSAW